MGKCAFVIAPQLAPKIIGFDNLSSDHRTLGMQYGIDLKQTETYCRWSQWGRVFWGNHCIEQLTYSNTCIILKNVIIIIFMHTTSSPLPMVSTAKDIAVIVNPLFIKSDYFRADFSNRH